MIKSTFFFLLCLTSAAAFSVAPRRASTALFSTMADSGVPPATADASSEVAEVEIPTNLPSDVGMDYVPLATMLATGQLADADQVSFSSTTSNLVPLLRLSSFLYRSSHAMP